MQEREEKRRGINRGNKRIIKRKIDKRKGTNRSKSTQ